MKKILLTLGGSLAFLALAILPAKAAVNSITPSTNDENKTKNWAHVDQIGVDAESVTFNFISTRSFWSCFEYRTDGDTGQKIDDDNFNADITDGLYPYYCQNNNSSTHKIEANNYVEIRMVFGAETDERFDWTRFDVDFNRTAEITSPQINELVSGNVSFDAILNDKDGDDDVQWAVRKGTCAAGQGTVFGNVDGSNDSFDWDGANFHAQADTTGWEEGDYCFVFNPTESAGDTTIREALEFVIDNTPPTKPEINGFLNPNLSCGAVTNAHSITVDWTDSTDANFAGYEYFINYPKTDGTRGERTNFLTGSQYSGSLNEGIHYIKVRAKDKAGNLSDWSNECSITADWTAPEITLEQPENGNVYGETIPFKAVCDETCDYINFWWTKAEESFDPADKQYHYVYENGTNFVWDGLDIFNEELWEGTFNGPMDDGEYRVYAAGKDLAGNWARSEYYTIMIDKDTDDDDVMNNEDLCSEPPTGSESTENVNPNHFVWPGDGLEFFMGVNEKSSDKSKGKAKGPEKSFDMEDTFGCNCNQIIKWLGAEYPEEYGQMLGQEKYGCSIGTMEEFIDLAGMEE